MAILYFEIRSNDAEQQVLKKGLAEMLISDVAVDPGITVVERDRLEEVMAELKLQQTKAVDASTAQKLGELLGAEYQVMGSVIALKTSARLDARVLEVRTAKVVGVASENVADQDFFGAEQRLAAKLNALLAKADSREAPKPKKVGSKLTMEHAVIYSQALDAKDKKDKKTAQEKLNQVVKAQPDFLLASLELDRLMK